MKRLFALLGVLLLAVQAHAAPPRHLLATTFPVYQITRHIIGDIPNVQLQLMIPAQAGCPHDYALTPQDRRKLAQADAVIINGLGMDSFIEKAVQEQGLPVLDSSKGIADLLTADEHEHEHEEHHEAANPHLFASPRMVARMAMTLSAQLAALDPENATLYTRNATAYAQRMDTLADEAAALGARLNNRRIVTQHGVFDYLARDMGLSVVATVQSHETQAPSASEMLALVRTMKQERVGAIFTEPQYPDKIAATLAREAGVPAIELDPVANGPANAALNHYETVMRANLDTLERILGTH